MPSITVTHADSGVVLTSVRRSERVSPHVVRVTFGGGDLENFEYLGFDQWFRLAIPVHADDRFDNLPKKFGFGGLLKFLALPKGTRPVIRNYTIRRFDRDASEMDVDFIVHGDEGIAGPWAVSVEPGTNVALIDQGCGWNPVPAEQSLIVADESAMAAALGILRDMPRDATGHAIIEVFDEADRQDEQVPDGMDVHWVGRDPGEAPGTRALATLRDLSLGDSLYALAVGEQKIATGTRRHLVNERGIPKANVTFCGYWRVGKASMG
jgi:NADPH-dependent ferric siderophore reductase